MLMMTNQTGRANRGEREGHRGADFGGVHGVGALTFNSIGADREKFQEIAIN